MHTAAVPVAIAPRGYPRNPAPIQRLTASYGGPSDGADLIESAAALAKKWAVRLRIASFTVRPPAMFGGSIERGAEDLIVQRWSRRVREDALKQLEAARSRAPIPDVDVVIGAGIEWRDAVDDIPWGTRDMLLLGSGVAGPMSQVFLGSAASKILRHAPVPARKMPRELA